MSEQNQNQNPCPANTAPSSGPMNRVIDFRVPLHWLAGVAFASLWFAFNLDRGVTQMTKDYGQLLNNLTALSAKFESLEANLNAASSDQALLKFRVENLEAELRAIREMPGLRASQTSAHTHTHQGDRK